jgi:RimJ/RimL family protein N-acetyltransferase
MRTPVPRPPDPPPIALRPARPADRDLLRAWRNERSTRRWYLNPAPVSAADHRRWLEARLADPRCRIYVAERGGKAVGQVRLQRTPRGAEVSFSVAPPARGAGVGTAMLERATRRAARELGAARVRAHVRPENVASAVAFLKAGFRFTGLRRRGDATVYEFEYRTA